MKKLVSLIFGILIVYQVFPQQSNKIIKNSNKSGVCYAGKKINKIYIPPPDRFLKKTESKGGGSITIYYTGFSSQAKAAVEYAGSILESLLPADTRITISASWEEIKTPGVLGQSSITGNAPGWTIDALNPMAYYPVALAEKIAGKSLNEDLEADLQLMINSSQPWYLGTDGQTPVTKYDLVTVALHEICHGLGFYDSFSTDGIVGWYSTVPWIYDTFVENFSGNKLTDTQKFTNYSAALKNELTGGQLYFNGPLLKNYCKLNNYSVTRAKLWAPSKWDPGSSISHLDENNTLPANFLMTPAINFGEAIHNPGNYTFSILGDLGWINTRIIHKPMGDTEKHITETELSVTIKSDTSYNRNKVGVVYSFDKFQNSDTLYLHSQNSDDLFNTVIKIPYYNSELEYYFFVEDYFLRIYRPLLFNDILQSLEKFRYKVYVGTDTVKPVISHTRAEYYLESVSTIAINVTASDNIGVDSVYLEYKVNEGASKYIGMTRGKSDSYTANINAKSLTLRGGDSIQYRIFAKDSAIVANTSVLPQSGYFAVKIEETLSTLESYSTDFNGTAADFINNGFDISKPAGFSKFGLNSRHPYESPEAVGKSINYTSVLRHPLKLKESGMLINFNEIVLVEPGDSGSVFGSDNFYDYVILEGSKDFGKNWFKLADGYDSRYNTTWDSAYLSSVTEGNSTFIPTESLLRKHTIFVRPSDSIPSGDTLVIRFRLYSDPYAYGWGWVIEDLKINPLIDAVERVYDNQIKVYPNPGNGRINISNSGAANQNWKPLRFSIFNSWGICIIKDKISDNYGILADISYCPSGLYIIVLYCDDGVRTIKYSLIK